jgi:carboxyl-terminal processing protease
MPLRNLLLLLGTLTLSLICHIKAPGNHYARLVAQGIQLVASQSVHETSERELFENAMSGMLEGLDAYSQYLPPKVLKPLQEDLDQQFGGVGIVVEQNAESQKFIILSPSVGSPAQEAGIVAGDQIEAIDGEATEGMEFRELVARIRGEAGTNVRLRIRRASEDRSLEFALTRAIIDVPSVLGDSRLPDGSWDYVLQQQPDIGYIRINTFGEQTSGELRRALESLRGRVDSLIIDLRNNAGGSLMAAVDCCDMLLSQGTIVTTRGRNNRQQSEYSAGREIQFPEELPVVVLVNRFSASASEIVAACLQDHQRATVIGERTWGKGTVQSLFFLEGGRSAIKLTIANYSRPSGANIHRWDEASEEEEWGVRPNDGFLVKLDEEQLVALAQFRSRRDLSLDPLPPTSPASDVSGPTPDDVSNEVSDEVSASEGWYDDERQGEGVGERVVRELEREEDRQVSTEERESENGRDDEGREGVGEARDLDSGDWIGRDPQLRRAVEHLRGE